MNSEIIFKEIPNYCKSYVAGSDGNIYRKKQRFYKKLVSSLCSNGNYLHVSVLNSEAVRKSVMVHLLVCLAFNGEKPDDMEQVSHLDGNSHNNLPENLMWVTIKENHSHKILHKTDDNGLRNTRSNLDKDKLFVTRWLLANTNLTHQHIADIILEHRVMVSRVNNKSRYARSFVEVVNTGDIL